VQIREQDLVVSHEAILGPDRLLDLEQQVGVGPYLFGRGGHLGARRLELRVGDRRPFSGAGLDEHLVSALGQFGDAGRGDSDPELVALGLGRNANAHASSVKNIRKYGKYSEDHSVKSCRA
jgi:hypothetical protein